MNDQWQWSVALAAFIGALAGATAGAIVVAAVIVISLSRRKR